jgi:hypothetical protein
MRLICHCGAEAQCDVLPAGEVLEYIEPRTSPPVVSAATHFLEGPVKNWIQFHNGGTFCPDHGELIRKYQR